MEYDNPPPRKKKKGKPRGRPFKSKEEGPDERRHVPRASQTAFGLAARSRKDAMETVVALMNPPIDADPEVLKLRLQAAKTVLGYSDGTPRQTAPPTEAEKTRAAIVDDEAYLPPFADAQALPAGEPQGPPPPTQPQPQEPQ